jgi:ribosome assembly protein YihI (activator of Der GTPase)
LTNKEFENVIKTLKENDEFITSIYYYGKAHEITGIVDEDQSKTPTNNFVKEMYKLFKKLVKMIDIEVEYADKKNTTRPSDKINIRPLNELVKYPHQQGLKPYITLDETNKHLKDASVEMNNEIVSLEIDELEKLLKKLDTGKKVSVKDTQRVMMTLLRNEYENNEVVSLKIEELKKLLKKLETGKKISVKDKQRLMITLLRNEYANDCERTIYRDLNIVLHKYYFNPLHYITFPSDTDNYIYAFWDKSRHKKKLDIPLHHREIATYTQSDDGNYTKGENKIITRPYEINEPIITPDKLKECANEGEEIVADILNTIINNVVLNSELKSRGETSKKSVVEL